MTDQAKVNPRGVPMSSSMTAARLPLMARGEWWLFLSRIAADRHRNCDVDLARHYQRRLGVDEGWAPITAARLPACARESWWGLLDLALADRLDHAELDLAAHYAVLFRAKRVSVDHCEVVTTDGATWAMDADAPYRPGGGVVSRSSRIV